MLVSLLLLRLLKIAFETLGPINDEAKIFLSDLGKRLQVTTGDNRETAFLYQRLSMTVQRYHNLALRDTFGNQLADNDD